MAPQKDERIRVLLVIADRDERVRLEHVLSHSTWLIQAAGTLEEAAAVLKDSNAGVIVSGQRLPAGESWRSVLCEARKLEPAPNVVVTDRLADAALWAEVLNLGGYDVLPQPFDPAETFRVLTSAWRSWRDEWKRSEATRTRHSRTSAAA